MKSDLIDLSKKVYNGKRGGVDLSCYVRRLTGSSLNEIMETLEIVDPVKCTNQRFVYPEVRTAVDCFAITTTSAPNQFTSTFDSVSFTYDNTLDIFNFKLGVKFSYVNPATPNHITISGTPTILVYNTIAGIALVMTTIATNTFTRVGLTDVWELNRSLTPINASNYETLPIAINYTVSFTDTSAINTLTGQVNYTV